MLNHVIVPLDGSELAEEAITHAKNIVAPQGKITLLSAVDIPEVPIYGYYPPAAIPDYESAEENLLPRAQSYLDELGKHVKEDGFTVGTEAHVGEPAQVIIEAAERLKVDAIVMSTHGRSGLSRWLFGSVTSKVLSAKPCPVYVIPSKNK
ncbi:MAG: universal stress protein [Anaerolineae bacterium]|nr:universal stress protein [Anaerolineae bacterium]